MQTCNQVKPVKRKPGARPATHGCAHCVARCSPMRAAATATVRRLAGCTRPGCSTHRAWHCWGAAQRGRVRLCFSCGCWGLRGHGGRMMPSPPQLRQICSPLPLHMAQQHHCVLELTGRSLNGWCLITLSPARHGRGNVQGCWARCLGARAVAQPWAAHRAAPSQECRTGSGEQPHLCTRHTSASSCPCICCMRPQASSATAASREPRGVSEGGRMQAHALGAAVGSGRAGGRSGPSPCVHL
jgi:hypothetical protein